MSAKWERIGTSGYTQATVHHRVTVFYLHRGKWRVCLYERKILRDKIVNEPVKMAFRNSEREAKRLGQKWIKWSYNFEFLPPED